jgi:uncharacterized protein YjiS (DUF1127 family)
VARDLRPRGHREPAGLALRVSLRSHSWRWWQERRARARTRRELDELSEHLLKDIGLPRGVIELLFR